MESDEQNQSAKTWLGSSISDICKGKGPWSFNITPVAASKYHAVLYKLPVTLKRPPRPHENYQPHHWDKDYVKMPYSERNLFPVVEAGQDVIKIRWNIIKESLSKPIMNSRQLETAIKSYNGSLQKFLALHYFFEEILDAEERDHFFSNLLPKIINLALQLPEIVPGSVPLLKKNHHNRSISLSQLQIACLLANAFLCTFPWRKDVTNLCPGINFTRLFAAHARPKRQSCVSEKLKCLFHYFRRVISKNPLGVVTFERQCVPRGSVPRWDVLDTNLGNTKIHIDSIGTIEDDGQGFLQVDFANKFVGGGVLGYGCVQEEIRFVICPELIISRLFVEQLGDYEAIIVTGPERYSKYTGYGDTFKWDGNFEDATPLDEYGRRRTSICIIDATRFNKPSDQFFPSAMLRELNKAYVGFTSREKDNLAPVATGNWGCGAFRGSSELKSLIQLMACSATGRDLVYYSFGNENLRDEFYNMHMFLANNRTTVAQLWRFLCGFATSHLTQERLYAYLQQSFFDGKKQPTIKEFFGANPNVKDNSAASTSSNIRKSIENTQIAKEINSQEIMVDLNDFDEDIIPATPPEEIPNINKVVKAKLTRPNEDIRNKLPRTDIAELIDIIDGNANKSKEACGTESLLAEIDKLAKSTSNQLQGNMFPREEENEKMDVEFVDNDLNSPNSESKASKRKITDYFQIKPSKSS